MQSTGLRYLQAYLENRKRVGRSTAEVPIQRREEGSSIVRLSGGPYDGMLMLAPQPRSAGYYEWREPDVETLAYEGLYSAGCGHVLDAPVQVRRDRGEIEVWCQPCRTWQTGKPEGDTQLPLF